MAPPGRRLSRPPPPPCVRGALPVPEPLPDLHSAHSRVLQFADKLFTALAYLEAAGGLPRLASELKPAAVDRTAQAMKSTRQAIDDQLAALKAIKRR